MLQTAFLLHSSRVMESVSMFAAVSFHLFLVFNVANSKEDNSDSIVSVRSISELLLTTSVFLLIVVGIVFCGFCSKSKSKDSSRSEKSSSVDEYDTFGLESTAKTQNGNAVGASEERDWEQDADIYDCVNEMTGTQSPRTPNSPYQKESDNHGVRSDCVIPCGTEMIDNIAYESVDSVQDVEYDDSDLYDRVGSNTKDGNSKSDEVKQSLKHVKRTVGISFSEPSNTSTLSSCGGEISGQHVNTSVQKVPLHRRQSAPHSIKSGTKTKHGKAMTLQFGSSLRTPLDPLPEEDYHVTELSNESRNDSNDSEKDPVVKGKSQTLKPITRRNPGGDALVYELCKVQQMRKGVTNKNGGTLPDLRNCKEKMTEVENDQCVTDDSTSQEEGTTEEMLVTCHGDNDDVTYQQSVSSCSDKSDLDSFDEDSISSTDDDTSIQDNKETVIVAMDTSEPDQQCEHSHQRGPKHNYVNIDATSDFRSEISEEGEDDDAEIYDNLGANRESIYENSPTSERGLSVSSQDSGTSPDNGISQTTVDPNQIYTTCRYEDAMVNIQRRTSQLKKATLIKEDEQDEGDESDDIFYPNETNEGDEHETERERYASRTVLEQAQLVSPTFSVDQSQKRPHKIFTNESFLRIQEAIAMQQALNSNPPRNFPIFASRHRVQRFSL